jgi:threonine dehydratase
MNKETLIQVHDKVKPYIHRTPVLTSELINEITGCKVFFKCENFQKMGAFKMRGAANAILSLSEEQRNCGVVTHSSGNFAQALSLAATKMNVKAYIVMPKNAPQVKKDAVKNYKGEYLLVEISYGFSAEAILECEGYWNKELIWNSKKICPAQEVLKNFTEE